MASRQLGKVNTYARRSDVVARSYASKRLPDDVSSEPNHVELMLTEAPRFDSTWTTQSGVSIFPNQRRHCNIVPQLQIDPLLLPAGFARLAAAGLLSPDLIVVLLRAVEHGLTGESLPQHGLVSRQYVPRKYHDFREACPCMDRQDSFDALIVHTIQIFCAIGFTEARIPTNILAMPRFSLSLNLPTYIPESNLEQDCLLWIWMLTIEAFTSRTGAEVVGQGKFLLSKFKQHFCTMASPWFEIEQVLRQFFWTPELTGAWEIRWQSLTKRG